MAAGIMAAESQIRTNRLDLRPRLSVWPARRLAELCVPIRRASERASSLSWRRFCCCFSAQYVDTGLAINKLAAHDLPISRLLAGTTCEY